MADKLAEIRDYLVEKLEKFWKKSKKNKIIVVVVAVTLFGFFTSFSENYEKQLEKEKEQEKIAVEKEQEQKEIEEQEKIDKEKERVEALSLEDYLAERTVDLGDGTPKGKDRLISVKTEDNTTYVDIYGDDLLSARKSSVDYLTTRYFKLIKDSKKINEVEEICLVQYYVFSDVKGNSKDDIGNTTCLTTKDINEINWDNFLSDNLDKVASTYYLHPAFKD